MLKRLTSIALCLCMIASLLFTSLPAIPVRAQEQKGQLLQNTGFETGDLTGWNSAGTVTVRKGGYLGNYSLEMEDQGELTQEVSVVGGTEYTFSAAVRRINDAKGTIKAEFYDADGNLIADANNVGVILQDASATTSDWKKIEKTFTALEGAVKLKLSIQRSSGRFYIDDITLTGLGEVQEYTNGGSRYQKLTAGGNVVVTPCEMLYGGDFTNLNDWLADSGKKDTNFTVTADGYEGSAVKFQADSSNQNLILKQIAADFAGGSEYTISGWFKVVTAPTAGSKRSPAVKLEFSTDEGRLDDRLSTTYSFPNDYVVGEWTKVEFKVYVPATATKVTFLLRTYDGADVLFDNFSMMGTHATNSIDIKREEGQLLQNTGFETGDVTGWNSAGTVVVLNGGYLGNHSVEMESQGELTQEVSVVAGTEYTFSAAIRRTNDAKATIKAEFYDADGNLIADANNVGVILQDASGTTSDWKKIEKTFTAPEGAVKLKLIIQHNSGRFYIDDITLTGLGEVQGYTNGGSRYEELTTGENIVVIPSEMLYGGDFTNLNDWVEDTGKKDTNFTVTADGYDGSAVKFQADSKYPNLILRQFVYDVAGGSEYTISGWFKVVTAPTAGSKRSPAIKLEFATNEGRLADRLATTYNFPNDYVVGEWTKVEFKVYVPATATKVTFYLRTYDGADVLFDNISMMGTHATNSIHTDKIKVDPDTQPNIILNGDFDSLNDWRPSREECVELVADREGDENSKTLHLTAVRSGLNPFVEQRVANIKPGSEYKLEGWFKTANLGEGSYAYIKAEFYTERAVVNATSNGAVDLNIGSADEWTHFSQTLEIPDGTVLVCLFFRLRGTGELYFDDITGRRSAETLIFTDVEDKTFTPDDEGYDNLLTNDDFEELDSGINGCAGWQTEFSSEMNDWASSVNGGGKYIELVDGKESDTAVKLYAGGEDDFGNPMIMQVVKGVEPNVSYQLSADIQSSSVMNNTGSTAMTIYFFDTEELNYNAIVDKQTFYLPNTNGWETKAVEFTAPAGIKSMAVIYRVYGQGELLVDNARLQVAERAARLDKVETDHFYYYLEWETGTVTTTLNELGYAQPNENDTITVTITKQGETEPKFTDTKPAAKTVEFTFDLADLEAEYGDAFDVKAVYNDANGDDGDELTAAETFKTYKRPTHLDENGVYHTEDGKPFFPVMAYHINMDEYAEAAEAGITVVQSQLHGGTVAEYADTLQKILDEAHKNGQMVLVALYVNGNAGRPELRDSVESWVRATMDHPATFAYAVQDEPLGKNWDPENLRQQLRDAYAVVRDIDPDHPVYICESAIHLTREDYEFINKVVDIFCIDPYPGDLNPAGDAYVVYDSIEQIVDIADGKKPVYSLLQAWSYKTYTPSSNDINHMIYQSIAAGAIGLGYYPIVPEYGDAAIWERPCYPGIKNFADNDEKAMAQILTGQKSYFNVDTNADDSLWYMSWMEGEDLFVVAMNMAADAQTNALTVTIPLASADGNTLFNASAAEVVYYDEEVYTTIGEPALTENAVTIGLVGGQIVKMKVSGEAVDADPAIEMHSIILEGTIGVNYWTKLSDAVLADADAYMQFTMADGTVKKVPVADAKTQTYGGESYYTFRCDVAAKEMTDVITAQIISAAGNSAEDTYCVKDYADGVIANAEADAKFKALVTNMLHYGAYAQQQFKYNTDNLANKGLTALDLSDVSIEDLADYEIENCPESVALGLILETDTIVRLWLDTDNTEVAVTDSNDASLTVVPKKYAGFDYYVDVAKVAAQDLDKEYTVTIVDGTTETSVTFSALSYAYNTLKASSNPEALQNVVKALYLYNVAANAYFN